MAQRLAPASSSLGIAWKFTSLVELDDA